MVQLPVRPHQVLRALNSTAGGEAAVAAGYLGLATKGANTYSAVSGNSTVGEAGQAAGGLLAAYGAYEGFERGGVVGDMTGVLDTYQTARSAYNLYNGATSGTSAAVTAADASGGAATSATLSAQGGAGATSGALGTLSTTAGELAAAYSVYNFVAEEKPGATGQDTLRGAEAGAAIGSVVGPIGTIVGGVIGGVVGAVSSLFGNQDSAKTSWQNYVHNVDNDQAAATTNPEYLMWSVGGLWQSQDGNFPGIRNYSNGNQFTTAMANQISSAIESGKISASTPASTVYSQVVAPWLASMPGGNNWSKSGVQAQEQSLVQDVVANYMAGKPITWGETQGQAPEYGYTSLAQAKAKATAPTSTVAAKPAAITQGQPAVRPIPVPLPTVPNITQSMSGTYRPIGAH